MKRIDNHESRDEKKLEGEKNSLKQDHKKGQTTDDGSPVLKKVRRKRKVDLIRFEKGLIV